MSPDDAQPESYFRQAAAAAGPTTNEDHTHAMLAHLLAAGAAFITVGFFISVFAPLLVLVFNKTRHPFVLYHINQAMWFQLAVFGINLVLATVITIITFLTCGIGVFLFAILPIIWLIGHVGLPLYLAFRTNEGGWDSYVAIGDLVMNSRNPLIK